MDFLHVEVGLAEILGGLELLGLLYVEVAHHALVGGGEVSRRLTCQPACGHVRNLRRRNKEVEPFRDLRRYLGIVDGD